MPSPLPNPAPPSPLPTAARPSGLAPLGSSRADKDGELTLEEFKEFWLNVLNHGYGAEEVLEEIQAMVDDGSSWRDWNDGRST